MTLLFTDYKKTAEILESDNPGDRAFALFLRPHPRLQNSRFRKAGSAVSVILDCEAREPHTPAGHVRRENDCRLSIQRIRSKEGLYNVTEVTEIA